MSGCRLAEDEVVDETSRMSALDLYEDLLVRENEGDERVVTMQEVLSEKQLLAEQNKELMEQLVEKTTQAEKLLQEKNNLQKNFEILLATAKVELERKNKLLNHYVGGSKSSSPSSGRRPCTSQSTDKHKKQSISLKGQRISEEELLKSSERSRVNEADRQSTTFPLLQHRGQRMVGVATRVVGSNFDMATPRKTRDDQSSTVNVEADGTATRGTAVAKRNFSRFDQPGTSRLDDTLERPHAISNPDNGSENGATDNNSSSLSASRTPERISADTRTVEGRRPSTRQECRTEARSSVNTQRGNGLVAAPSLARQEKRNVPAKSSIGTQPFIQKHGTETIGTDVGNRASRKLGKKVDSRKSSNNGEENTKTLKSDNKNARTTSVKISTSDMKEDESSTRTRRKLQESAKNGKEEKRKPSSATRCRSVSVKREEKPSSSCEIASHKGKREMYPDQKRQAERTRSACDLREKLSSRSKRTEAEKGRSNEPSSRKKAKRREGESREEEVGGTFHVLDSTMCELLNGEPDSSRKTSSKLEKEECMEMLHAGDDRGIAGGSLLQEVALVDETDERHKPTECSGKLQTKDAVTANCNNHTEQSSEKLLMKISSQTKKANSPAYDISANSPVAESTQLQVMAGVDDNEDYQTAQVVPSTEASPEGVVKLLFPLGKKNPKGHVVAKTKQENNKNRGRAASHHQPLRKSPRKHCGRHSVRGSDGEGLGCRTETLEVADCPKVQRENQATFDVKATDEFNSQEALKSSPKVAELHVKAKPRDDVSMSLSPSVKLSRLKEDEAVSDESTQAPRVVLDVLCDNMTSGSETACDGVAESSGMDELIIDEDSGGSESTQDDRVDVGGKRCAGPAIARLNVEIDVSDPVPGDPSEITGEASSVSHKLPSREADEHPAKQQHSGTILNPGTSGSTVTGLCEQAAFCKQSVNDASLKVGLSTYAQHQGDTTQSRFSATSSVPRSTETADLALPVDTSGGKTSAPETYRFVVARDRLRYSGNTASEEAFMVQPPIPARKPDDVTTVAADASGKKFSFISNETSHTVAKMLSDGDSMTVGQAPNAAVESLVSKPAATATQRGSVSQTLDANPPITTPVELGLFAPYKPSSSRTATVSVTKSPRAAGGPLTPSMMGVGMEVVVANVMTPDPPDSCADRDEAGTADRSPRKDDVAEKSCKSGSNAHGNQDQNAFMDTVIETCHPSTGEADPAQNGGRKNSGSKEETLQTKVVENVAKSRKRKSSKRKRSTVAVHEGELKKAAKMTPEKKKISEPSSPIKFPLSETKSKNNVTSSTKNKKKERKTKCTDSADVKGAMSPTVGIISTENGEKTSKTDILVKSPKARVIGPSPDLKRWLDSADQKGTPRSLTSRPTKQTPSAPIQAGPALRDSTAAERNSENLIPLHVGNRRPEEEQESQGFIPSVPSQRLAGREEFPMRLVPCSPTTTTLHGAVDSPSVTVDEPGTSAAPSKESKYLCEGSAVELGPESQNTDDLSESKEETSSEEYVPEIFPVVGDLHRMSDAMRSYKNAALQWLIHVSRQILNKELRTEVARRTSATPQLVEKTLPKTVTLWKKSSAQQKEEMKIRPCYVPCLSPVILQKHIVSGHKERNGRTQTDQQGKKHRISSKDPLGSKLLNAGKSNENHKHKERKYKGSRSRCETSGSMESHRRQIKSEARRLEAISSSQVSCERKAGSSDTASTKNSNMSVHRACDVATIERREQRLHHAIDTSKTIKRKKEDGVASNSKDKRHRRRSSSQGNSKHKFQENRRQSTKLQGGCPSTTSRHAVDKPHFHCSSSRSKCTEQRPNERVGVILSGQTPPTGAGRRARERRWERCSNKRSQHTWTRRRMSEPSASTRDVDRWSKTDRRQSTGSGERYGRRKPAVSPPGNVFHRKHAVANATQPSKRRSKPKKVVKRKHLMRWEDSSSSDSDFDRSLKRYKKARRLSRDKAKIELPKSTSSKSPQPRSTEQVFVSPERKSSAAATYSSKKSLPLSRNLWMSSLQDCQERRRKRARWSSEISEDLVPASESAGDVPRDQPTASDRSPDGEVHGAGIDPGADTATNLLVSSPILDVSGDLATTAGVSFSDVSDSDSSSECGSQINGAFAEAESPARGGAQEEVIDSDFFDQFSMPSWQLSEESRCRFNAFAKVVRVLSPLKPSPVKRLLELPCASRRKRPGACRKVLQTP